MPAIFVTALCLWTSESIHRAWLERKTGNVPHMLSRFLLGLKPLVQFALYMLPVYFVLRDYYLLQSLKDHQNGNHPGMEWIADYFWGIKSIVYFTDWHLPFHKVLLGLLGLPVVFTLIHRIRRRQWLQTTNPFLLPAILFTLLFIRAPWSYGPDDWINGSDPSLHLVDIGALVAICLIHLGRSTYDQAHLNGELRN